VSDITESLNELEWSGPEPDDREPRKCRRHDWVTNRNWNGTLDNTAPPITQCVRCNAIRDDAATRRGKNNRSRGNAIERAVGKELGLRRVGQYGGPDDLSGLAFAAQVKSGGAFSERYWSWLKAVPVTANQTPILVVTDAPGPGHKRRALVVLELSDWRALHGEDAA
jgi:hypothetical protein